MDVKNWWEIPLWPDLTWFVAKVWIACLLCGVIVTVPTVIGIEIAETISNHNEREWLQHPVKPSWPAKP